MTTIKYDNDYINQFMDRCKSFPRVKVELVKPNVLEVQTEFMYEGYAWIGASEHNINNGCRGVKEYNYALVDSTHLTIYFIDEREDNKRLKAELRIQKKEHLRSAKERIDMIKAYKGENDELKAENERLKNGFGHGVLVELETLREERDEMREDNNEYIQYNDKLKAELKTAQDSIDDLNDVLKDMQKESIEQIESNMGLQAEFNDYKNNHKAELEKVKRCNKTMDGILLERDAEIKTLKADYKHDADVCYDTDDKHIEEIERLKADCEDLRKACKLLKDTSHYPKEYKTEADEYFHHNPQSKGIRFHIIDFNDYDYNDDSGMNGGSGEYNGLLLAEDCLLEIDNPT